ncbi:glycosyl transferase [Luteitalea sp. TBR-22]|uniref:glycosyltransferase family 2 protein n=1 Tax=Luteitalea sp. TBR-22 TaxID=2802971 RepID=UPI001AFC6020|nr:glycosyltransferase family 2 protein [Luteitalea sp. TBR-22]BCS33696.1 glycosyl transferase [Luteitalea sp. TBR-22]
MSVGVSIVVVTFNAREDALACLASVHAHPPARPWDVIVVDNHSGDGTADAIAARWPEVPLRRLPENLGFAAANNIGIRATAHPYVLLLNSDTLVGAGQLEALCAALDDEPAAAAAGPRLLDGTGQQELSYGPMISPLGEARQKVRSRLLAAGPAAVRARIAADMQRRQWVDWVSGACLLVRRAAAEAVGLLDERFFMYCEDVDFCAALRAAGHGILYAPDVSVTHLRGRSRATAPTATTRRYRDSQLAFYRKHHPRWARLLRWYLAARDITGRSS